jgi:hypothetical protein
MTLPEAIEQLLNTGFVQLDNERDTIEIVQHFRYAGEDMERIDLDLKNFQIFWVV